MTLWTELAGLAYSIRHVPVGRWSTRVLESGSGMPLILLHGTGGHLEAYAKNLRALSPRVPRHRLRLSRHGWTTTAEADLDIDDYIDHLLGLMDGLGIERAHLSGESLGGWVAAKLAARHPDRVDRLVLNTPGGTMATPEVMERIRSLSQAAADDPTDERIRARLEWLMADPRSVTDELVAIRRGVYSRPGFARSMRHILCLLLARQAADVALLSGGRLRLGVGLGYNAVEYHALGQDFGTRGRTMGEQIPYLRRLWTEPMTFGYAFRDEAVRAWRRVQELLREEGRSTDGFRAVFNLLPEAPGSSPIAQIVDVLPRLREAGATGVTVTSARYGLSTLDQHIDFITEVRTHADKVLG